jgi:hypothetical protein
MRIDRLKIREIDEITNWNYKVYAAAKMYAESGLYVIPVRPGEAAIPPSGVSYPHASKRTKIIDKWYGPGGTYEGWNVGLACGKKDGIFVIDIDKEDKQGRSGYDMFDQIKPVDWTFIGPVQLTPKGGRHLIMQWREHARCTQGRSGLGEAIDTRGGDADQCRGHIVAWPSMRTAKNLYPKDKSKWGQPDAGYAWEEVGEIPPCPDWVIDRLGAPLSSARIAGRGNENVAEGDYEDKFSLEKIQSMLEIIDPDELSYDEWCNIGMAIHTQHPTKEGLRLWDEWSRDGDRYQRGECSKRWAGFNPGGTVRVGTLIAHAQQRGYDLALLDEKRAEHDDEIDALVSKMNKSYAVCPMGSDIMVIEKCEVVPEMANIQPKYRFWKKAGFRNYFENQLMVSITHDGKPKKMTHADIWLGHPDRATYPAGVGLFPNKPARYCGYFNLWQGFAVEPKQGIWDSFNGHLRHVICAGNDELYEWVLDWIADLFQDPGNPKGTALVLHGTEGCGKGTLGHVLGQAFGTHYKHVTDDKHLVGNFNWHLSDGILVFADEAVFGGDRKIAGKLKSLVTEKVLMSEKKGVDAIQFRNCAHLIAASNESWFIPAGPQSRRWLVLDVSGHRANDEAYFDNIFREAHGGGVAAMMYDLMEREIKSNLRLAPHTEALQMQREQYSVMDSAVEWWLMQLNMRTIWVPSLDADTHSMEPWPKSIIKNDVLVNYRQWCNDQRTRRVSNARFFSTLKKAGLTTKRVSRGGTRIYAFEIPDHKTCEAIAEREFGYVKEKIKDED